MAAELAGRAELQQLTVVEALGHRDMAQITTMQAALEKQDNQDERGRVLAQGERLVKTLRALTAETAEALNRCLLHIHWAKNLASTCLL